MLIFRLIACGDKDLLFGIGLVFVAVILVAIIIGYIVFVSVREIVALRAKVKLPVYSHFADLLN